MTTPILVLIYAVAAVVIFGIFAGIPMWIIRRHPDTAPDNGPPEYLQADWKNLPAQKNLAGAGQESGRLPERQPGCWPSRTSCEAGRRGSHRADPRGRHMPGHVPLSNARLGAWNSTRPSREGDALVHPSQSTSSGLAAGSAHGRAASMGAIC
jgi:hypothetical protein